MNPLLRFTSSFFLILSALLAPLLVAHAQDTGIDARLRAQERAQQNTEAAQAVHRCCVCTRPGTDGFCTKLTGATSCNAYRESSSFLSLPRENQNTLTDYACRDLDPSACEGGTQPTTPATQNAARPTPPSGTAPTASATCPRTFADFTAVAADIRPIAPPLPPDPNPFVSITPVLGVAIPGLSFSPARKEGALVYVPFLAQYIAAVERYAVGLALIAAIVMIVYGGFRYLLGSAFGDVAAGKQIVLDAIIGLLLALGAYMILNTVNPNTLELPEIKLGYINPSYYGESEGANEPIRVGSGQSCRCSPIPQGINPASVLKVPCYRQYDASWGAQAYGANLLPSGEATACSYSYSATLPACSGSGAQNSSCMGTLGQGGCGPSSLAVVMAYYGVQMNGHLITPLDAAQYAVRACLRPQNGGTTNICSRRFEQEFPGFTCSGQGGGNKAERAAQEIRAGHPVIFHCAHCNVTKQSGNIASGSVGDGHYMVLTGVNETGTIFAVHDVGHEGASAAVAISGDEVNSSRVALYIIHQPTQTVIPPAEARCTATGGGRRWAGSGSRQAITLKPFTYCPGAGQGRCGGGWDPDQAWFMYPTRLKTAPSPHIRLFIYIHGLNSDVDSASDNHTRLLRNSLSKALPDRDIVIAAPHWYGPDNQYMHGFNLRSFYEKATAAIRAEFPSATIVDVAVGGHSAATCNGTLKQALTGGSAPLLTPARGFVVYDGCESDGDSRIYDGHSIPGGGIRGSGASDSSVNGQNFTPHGIALIVGPDAVGMGIESSRRDPVTGVSPRDRISASQRSWGFNTTKTTPCPSSVPMGGIDCYAHPTETAHNNEWWEMVTHQDHASNVETITDIAFRAFYGSN